MAIAYRFSYFSSTRSTSYDGKRSTLTYEYHDIGFCIAKAAEVYRGRPDYLDHTFSSLVVKR